MNLHAQIIGAGIGGLASAIRLAVKGYKVNVYEQSDHPGGKLNQIRWEDYRWDTGPSLFTLPDLVEELFMLCGEEMKISIRYDKLDVVTRYFYESGMVINAFGEPQKFISEASRVTGEPAKRIQKYLDRSREIYDLTRDVFIFNTFNRLKTFVSPEFIRALSRAWKLDPLVTMHDANTRRFESEQLIQLFDRYATYNGSNPFRAPGTLNMISHLEHNLGAYFPEKGMYSIGYELYELARRQGVHFHFNSPVDEVVIDRKRVKGIKVKGEFIESDLVISDMDIYYFYKDLLKRFPFPGKHFRKDRSTSALIFYWAIDRHFPDLDLHNVLFSGNYEEEFTYLFDKKEIYHDPTVYIFISSKKVNGDAPEMGENWFTMINVPENVGQDWDRYIEIARQKISEKINRMLGTDIHAHILKEFVADPRSIERDTFSYQGSLYGNNSNSRMAAFNRHPNFLRKLKGLYFVGGSVHPGGGIPLCLASAKIADRFIP